MFEHDYLQENNQNRILGANKVTDAETIEILRQEIHAIIHAGAILEDELREARRLLKRHRGMFFIGTVARTEIDSFLARTARFDSP